MSATQSWLIPVSVMRLAKFKYTSHLCFEFVVTTNSKHKCEVYLNLASRMTLTGINQLWVADITYVRLKGEFVYLAVILDSFSRKVVGWAVDRTMMSSHLTVALERAVADRQPRAGLVHHSDRGLQYAS